ncbi:MAG: PAS domain-containing protein [Solirubrobacteraceae bacterium]|nr:PAS domain-containing protein [Solirubrobacteraceae bacterium]
MTDPTTNPTEERAGVAASAHALTVVLEPDGSLRRVVRVGPTSTVARLEPGLPVYELAAAICGASAEPALWEAQLSAVREHPAVAVQFEVTVDPTANATQRVRREVVATPVLDRTGQLDCVVLQCSIGRQVDDGSVPIDPDADRFEELVAALPALVWSALPDGSLAYLSPEWERFTGIPVPRMLTNGYYDLIHADDLPAVASQQLEFDDDDRFDFPAFRLLHASGEYRWVDTSVVAVRNESGQIQRILGVTTDAASMHDAQIAEQRLSEQLSAALEVAGLGRFDVDIGTGLARLDARGREILGLERGDFDSPPLPIEALVATSHPDDTERVKAAIQRVFDGTDTKYRTQSRRVVQTPAGPMIRNVLGVGRLEPREHGHSHFVGVIHDLTAESAAAAAGLRAQKHEALGTLAGGIAHDFNNMISAITMSADVLEAEVARGGQPDEGIAEIRAAAERAAKLVRRLVSLSQDSAPELLPVDVSELAREVCTLMRPTLPRRVELVPPSPLTRVPPVLGSDRDLRQVLLNLIDNAGQELAEGGRIEVRVDTVELDSVAAAAFTRGAALGAGRYVRLVVTDDGPGIPADGLARIFDPFFTTRRPGGGTGLGLTATQSIVRGHGGAITADNRIGARGAEFRVLLPQADGG